MRSFAYKNPDFIKNEVVPELIKEHPCYQQSVYDTVMYDKSLDGDLIQVDMTQILLNQEKYRQLDNWDYNFTWAKWITPSRDIINDFDKEGDEVRKNQAIVYYACTWTE